MGFCCNIILFNTLLYIYLIKGSIPYVAIKQTSFDLLKNNFMVEKYRNTLNFFYGSLSGFVGTIILYPTYMIKRILQANSNLKELINLLFFRRS
jgi:hypothetical protein